MLIANLNCFLKILHTWLQPDQDVLCWWEMELRVRTQDLYTPRITISMMKHCHLVLHSGYSWLSRNYPGELNDFFWKDGVPSVPFSLSQYRLGIDYRWRFSCGSGTGFNYLEKSQLVFGDKTELQPKIVFAVDGSVNVSKTFGAQVGDSSVITKDGYVQLI